MAGLKKIFGKDMPLEKLPADLKELLEQIRQERAAIDDQLTRAEASITRIEQVAQSLAPAEARVAELEQRLAGGEQVAAHLAELAQQAARLAEEQRATGAQVAGSQATVEAVRAELEGIREPLERLTAAQQQLPELEAQVEPLMALGPKIEALAIQMRELGDAVEATRAEQETVEVERERSRVRLAELDQQMRDTAARFETFTMRAVALENTAEQLRQLIKDVPDVKRELSTLNVLADYVTRKVSALETQRDVVDRATQRAERLTELAAQIDRQLQEQHDNAKFLGRLQQTVEEIKKLYEVAASEAERVDGRHRAIEAEERRIEEQLAELRNTLQQSESRFQFEREGLDALAERIGTLRGALTAAEQRLPAVLEVRSGLEDMTSDLSQLSASVERLEREMRELEAAPATAAAVQAQVRQVEAAIAELTRRLDSVQSPNLDALDQAEERVDAVGEALQSLVERAARLERYGEQLDEIDRGVQARETAIESAMQHLDRAAALRQESTELVADLRQETEGLRQLVSGALEAGERAAEVLRQVEERAHQIEETRARLDGVEAKLGERDALEERVERALQLATERREAVDAVRADLQRLFEVADATVERARTVVGLQQEIEEREASLTPVLEQVRDLQHRTAVLDDRQRQFTEAEQRLAQLDGLLIGLKSTFQSVLDQQEFLERVVDTAGELALQTMQAETLVSSLRSAAAEIKRPDTAPGPE